MINEYYRPKTIEAALQLLKEPGNVLLHGYTAEHAKVSTTVNVVDVQDIGLNQISKNSKSISIGSTSTFQDIINCEYIPDSIKIAIKLDTPLNVRAINTLGSKILSWSGRSCLATILLALDATIQFADGRNKSSLTSFLSNRETNGTNNLISHLEIPEANSTFKFISATPTSRPFISAALSIWANGRTRLALGGHGKFPLLIIDGSIGDDMENAARIAYSNAGDEWASATYRSEMAAILTKRCILEINSNNN